MEDKKTTEISIIIVSYNTREFLRHCLESLKRDESNKIGEIIVIDNRSGDGSVEMITNEFPEVTLVRNRSNLGYARAVNQGVRLSRCKYFLILNPDIEITDRAVENLWSFMGSNPDVGIAGSKLLNPDGTLQTSCRTFYTLPIVLLRRTLLGKIFPNSKLIRKHLMLDWDHGSDRQVDWVMGACMMVRREAYEAVGGMDERFFLYLEDVDWCYRMQKHGWKVYYVHSAVMKHHHRRESARLLPDRRFFSHLFSTFRFYDKWNSALHSLKRERRILSVIGTVALDIVFINLAFMLAYYLRYLIRPYMFKPLYPIATYRGFMIFVNILCLFSFFYSGLYRKPRRAGFVGDLVVISRAILFSSLIIMAATYLTRTVAYSRLIVFVFWPISAVLVTAGRAMQRAVHRSLRRSFFDLRRVAIVGEDRDAVELRAKVLEISDARYDFVGYIVPAGRSGDSDLKPLLGSTEDIGTLVNEHRIHEVIVCDRLLSRQEMGKIVIRARRLGSEVKVVSEVTDMLIRGSLLEDVGGLPVVVFPPSSLSGASLATKYVVDFVAALIGIGGLIVLAPAVIIWQSLSHRNYKAWGRAIRLLAQVITGKRSLVGPLRIVNGERLRPGITGLWLAAGDLPGGTEKDRLDLYYLQNWSVTTDLEIMIISMKYLSGLFGASGGDATSKEGEE